MSLSKYQNEYLRGQASINITSHLSTTLSSTTIFKCDQSMVNMWEESSFNLMLENMYVRSNNGVQVPIKCTRTQAHMID